MATRRQKIPILWSSVSSRVKIHAAAWIFLTRWRRKRQPAGLDVEQEVHHIAIFHDVVFTFSTHFTGFFRALFAFVGNEVFISDGLRADKTFFEVGVDLTGCLRARSLRPGWSMRELLSRPR